MWTRGFGALIAILLWLPLAAVAQEEPEPPPPVLPLGTAILVADGEATPIPISVGAAGPLFALPQLVERLGGTLSTGALGQAFTLTLGETAIVIGAGSPAITIGTDIETLTQRAVVEGGAVRVPLDFLERTFGAMLGWQFEWRPAELQLQARKVVNADTPVGVDVVHLQGTTTVVLQFPTVPNYRIRENPGEIVVEVPGGRLRAAAAPLEHQDPWVRRVELGADRIRIELAFGAASDNYVLRDPFRLVFEVFQEPEGAVVETPQPRVPRPGIQTVVLDPGHGGSESGAVSASGTAEKELTLLLAQAVKRRLEERLGVRVVLTRDEDALLPLATRSGIANEFKADIFISIHLNSSTGSSARGAETYFLSPEASDEMASAAAARESASANSEEADALYSLQLILWDLAQTRHLSESQRLAKLIQGELNTELGLRDRGVKQAPFRVLMGAAMPAVLVELGFLSNPEEEKKLLAPAYRAQLADALVRALGRFQASALEAPAPAAAPAAPGERAPESPTP